MVLLLNVITQFIWAEGCEQMAARGIHGGPNYGIIVIALSLEKILNSLFPSVSGLNTFTLAT
jgi:hypothetical protein